MYTLLSLLSLLILLVLCCCWRCQLFRFFANMPQRGTSRRVNGQRALKMTCCHAHCSVHSLYSLPLWSLDCRSASSCKCSSFFFSLSLPFFLFAFCFGHLSQRGKLALCLDEYANIFWMQPNQKKRRKKLKTKGAILRAGCAAAGRASFPLKMQHNSP